MLFELKVTNYMKKSYLWTRRIGKQMNTKYFEGLSLDWTNTEKIFMTMIEDIHSKEEFL